MSPHRQPLTARNLAQLAALTAAALVGFVAWSYLIAWAIG